VPVHQAPDDLRLAAGANAGGPVLLGGGDPFGQLAALDDEIVNRAIDSIDLLPQIGEGCRLCRHGSK
jgi:hypothetical protein